MDEIEWLRGVLSEADRGGQRIGNQRLAAAHKRTRALLALGPELLAVVEAVMGEYDKSPTGHWCKLCTCVEGHAPGCPMPALREAIRRHRDD